MIVDDTQDSLLVLEAMLQSRFELIRAESGAECIELVHKSQPDILLLDVHMPGMNGYEVCTKLKGDQNTRGLPILFVSALVDVEERLAGFEAGGDAYISKPVDEDILLEKIERQLAHLDEKKNAVRNAAEAMDVAMTAMTSSSELGQIISFVTETQKLNSIEKMGEMLIEVCQGFGLNSCAYIEGGTKEFFGCSEDSIEAKVLKRATSASGKLISLGIRTIVKSEQLILLVKNMPTDDEKKYGRFKDHLVVLTSISDGRISSLHTASGIQLERRNILTGVITHTEKQIKSLNLKVQSYEENNRLIIMDMVEKLETTLFSLGLDEDQEEKLMSLVYSTSEQLEKSKVATKELQQELGTVLEGLYSILAKND